MTINTPRVSKKLLVALLAPILSYLALREGMSEQQVALILAPLLLYLPSQGLADYGKEAVREQAKAATAPKD